MEKSDTVTFERWEVENMFEQLVRANSAFNFTKRDSCAKRQVSSVMCRLADKLNNEQGEFGKNYMQQDYIPKVKKDGKQ